MSLARISRTVMVCLSQRAPANQGPAANRSVDDVGVIVGVSGNDHDVTLADIDKYRLLVADAAGELLLLWSCQSPFRSMPIRFFPTMTILAEARCAQ